MPFVRDEWTAERITAYFNLDLRQIRAYGFGDHADRLLVLLAFFKIQRFLKEGLRFRSACDLEVVDVGVTRPVGFEMPTLESIEAELPSLIQRVGESGQFGETRVLTVTYRK